MAAFETKNYRNIFAEIGKSEEEIQKKIKDAVNVFFYGSEEERIYHPAGEDMGYLEDTGNHDARTEGMSYGMMICVQLDMKEEFDYYIAVIGKLTFKNIYGSNTLCILAVGDILLHFSDCKLLIPASVKYSKAALFRDFLPVTLHQRVAALGFGCGHC